MAKAVLVSPHLHLGWYLVAVTAHSPSEAQSETPLGSPWQPGGSAEDGYVCLLHKSGAGGWCCNHRNPDVLGLTSQRLSLKKQLCGLFIERS